MDYKNLKNQIKFLESEYGRLVEQCNNKLIPKRRVYLNDAIRNFTNIFVEYGNSICENEQSVKAISSKQKQIIVLNKPNICEIDSLYLLLITIEIISPTVKKITYKLCIDESTSSYLRALINCSVSTCMNRERMLKIRLKDVNSRVLKVKKWLAVLNDTKFQINLYFKNIKQNDMPFENFSEAFRYITSKHSNLSQE